MVKTITHIIKDEKNAITHVKADDGRVYSKWDITSDIELHVKVIVPNGTKVHVVKTDDGKKYIRTDGNDTPEDNLGNLPTFTL